MEVTEYIISVEQGSLTKGKGYMDQNHTMRIILEKYLAKGKKLFAAFMDPEKAYD